MVAVGQPLPGLVERLLAGEHLLPGRSIARRRRPASTAASNTRTDAAQMSGPMPSPSMNGMIGSSGTWRPFGPMVIAVAIAGS